MISSLVQATGGHTLCSDLTLAINTISCHCVCPVVWVHVSTMRDWWFWTITVKLQRSILMREFYGYVHWQVLVRIRIRSNYANQTKLYQTYYHKTIIRRNQENNDTFISVTPSKPCAALIHKQFEQMFNHLFWLTKYISKYHIAGPLLVK